MPHDFALGYRGGRDSAHRGAWILPRRRNRFRTTPWIHARSFVAGGRRIHWDAVEMMDHRMPGASGPSGIHSGTFVSEGSSKRCPSGLATEEDTEWRCDLCF